MPGAGLCLRLAKQSEAINRVYEEIQKAFLFTPFSILLSGDDLSLAEADDTFLEAVAGLFFQPSYYMVNYHPVVFLKDPASSCTNFIERLQHKCRSQGLQRISTIEIKAEDHRNDTTPQFGYWANKDDIDYHMLVKNWLAQYLGNNNPSEIHILFPYKAEESAALIKTSFEKENAVKRTEDYQIASAFYEKEKIIEAYKHQLSMKAIDLQNNQLYLSIQKEERVNALEWYRQEYEILPLWYKRFGHIIKVLTGKRTFMSLFNDNVKKHKT